MKHLCVLKATLLLPACTRLSVTSMGAPSVCKRVFVFIYVFVFEFACISLSATSMGALPVCRWHNGEGRPFITMTGSIT